MNKESKVTINFVHNVGYKNPATKIYIEDNLKEKT